MRAGALLAVIAGLLLSSLTGSPAARVAQRAGHYTVLAGDFHVHGFPDGIPPWDAAREAKRRRLDVIALTSHNSRFGWWMWTHRPGWIGVDGVIVLPGEELTSVGYHMALVGLSSTIGWDRSMAEAAAAAHAQGAVAILAHPAGAAVKRVATDEGLRAVDGVEVAHPGMESADRSRRDYLAMFQRALSVDPGTAAIGSSDFHYFEALGACRTYLFVTEISGAGVLDAIRSGRTVACDGRGGVYGPAGLRALVADRCRDDARRPPDGDGVLARLATAAVWAGLLALVLAGASST